MGAAEGSDRIATLSLAIVLALCLLVPMIPSATASPPSGMSKASSSSVQYSQSAQFENGTVFNEYGSAILTDHGVCDFVIGDVDNDGKTEAVVISSQTNAILIYHRLANGLFSSTPERRIFRSDIIDLRSVAIGDLNNDGLNDIAVSCNSTGHSPEVAIFYQNNSFNPADAKILNLYRGNPSEVEIGHFTNKTLNSVAVLCEGSPTMADDEVDIWSQPMTNGSSDHTYLMISNFTKSRLMASADIDGDGLTDIVVAQEGAQNVALFNHTKLGGWNSQQTLNIPNSASAIELADVNGDGRPDLIFASAAASRIFVILNTGKGFYSTGGSINPILISAAGVTAVTFGDVNGDGNADAIWASNSGSNVSASFAITNTSWSALPSIIVPVNKAPIKVVVDDAAGNTVRLFVLSAGNGISNSTLEEFSCSPELSSNADLNLFTGTMVPGKIASGHMADGSDIIASIMSGSNKVLVYDKNTGLRRLLQTSGIPVDLVFGNFDGDSSDDLAILCSSTSTVNVYTSGQYASGTAPLVNITIPFTDASCITQLSVRNNSRDDLVIGSGHGILVLYNTGTSSMFSLTQNETFGTSCIGSTVDIVAGDFDHDGNATDLAVLNNNANSTIEVFLRQSPGTTWDYYPQTPTANLTYKGSSMKEMVVGNFGGPTGEDLAVLDSTNRILIYDQTSQGYTYNWSLPVVLAIKEPAVAIGAGDINDHGWDDLVIAYANTPIVDTYLRNGAFTFQEGPSWTSGGICTDVKVCDLNADLREDIVCSAPDSHSLSMWFQNNLVPHANATASAYTAPEGQNITFSGAGSKDSYSDQNNLTCQWLFNSTYQPTGTKVNATYWQYGTYKVTLKVTDRGGLSNWSNLSIVVTRTYPKADFTFTPTSQYEGENVTFTDNSSSYPQTLKLWNWSFGDGQYNDFENPVHIYQHTGTYYVRLNVTDSDGGWASITKKITIQDIVPVAKFIYSPSSILEGQNYTFTSHSTAYDGIKSYEWNFGDGRTNSSAVANHPYILRGVYMVVLTVTDNDGSVSRAYQNVTVVDISPVANFTCSNTSPIEGSLVLFNDTSYHYRYDPIVSWLWDFGDGNTSHLENAIHKFAYDHSAPYVVKLTITDSDGNTSTYQMNITVLHSVPKANFTYSPENQTEGQAVHFVDDSQAYNKLWNWTWDFGDGNTSTLENPSHAFAINGTYYVVLTVTDINGSMNSTTKPVTIVKSIPTANFTISPGHLYEGFTVWFNDTSTSYDLDPITSWLWDFDGRFTSTTENCTHIFMESGLHNVTLTVVNVKGATNTSYQQIRIDDKGPTAAFSNSTCIEGQTTHFYNESTTPASLIVKWRWDFGDGTPVAWGEEVSHIYNRSGEFKVTLTVWDNESIPNTTSRMINVTEVGPIAAFSYTPTSPYETQTVWFTNESTTYNRIVNWTWDFGDKSPVGWGEDVNHTYARSGTYNVTLTVYEFYGASDNVTHQIVVLETNPTIISMTAAPQRQIYDEDSSIQIYVNATKATYGYGITHYQFDFNYDGTFTVDMDTTLNHTSVSYSKMGTYRIMVRVFDSINGFNQTSLMVEIRDPAPIAQFSYWDIGSNTIQFNASLSTDTSSDVNNLSYSWNFDDGGGFTEYLHSAKVVNHHFPQGGVYNVTLCVSDDEGVVGTTYRITILTCPSVTFEGVVGTARIDQAITISANVTDPFGLYSVVLCYSIDNGTEQNVNMSQGTLGNYEAQIQGVNRTAVITYWIFAEDVRGNSFTTGHYDISVVAASGGDSALILALVIIVLAAVFAFLYVRSTRAAVDEVFIIYEDGRLIAHQTRRLKPGMDDEILSSMLIAIQSFVKDSFKDETATRLERLDFGEKKILIEKGDHFFVAVVLHGERPGSAPHRIQQVIASVQAEHGRDLVNWDGNLENLRGVKDLTAPLIGGKMIKTGKGEAAMAECPACASKVGAEDTVCPSCGASLKGGELDDLEAVASDLSEKKE